MEKNEEEGERRSLTGVSFNEVNLSKNHLEMSSLTPERRMKKDQMLL